jgi:putative ABC transport system substrate-binding protein
MGLLSLGPPSTFPTLMDAFREGMREIGYVEGTHYVLDMRNAGGKPDELPDVARMLVAQGVDVILVSGTTLAAAAAATETIPIVLAGTAPQALRQGQTADLARPRDNIAGVTGTQMKGVPGKHLEFLREIVPNMTRVLVMMNPASQSAEAGEIEAAARALGLAFMRIPVTRPEHIDSGLATLRVRQGDGLIVLSESHLYARRAHLAELIARKKLPAIYGLRHMWTPAVSCPTE